MICLFPTYASRNPSDQRWQVRVAGMLTKSLPPESRRRSMAMGLLRRVLELDAEQLASTIFQTRANAFLFDRLPRHTVQIKMGHEYRETCVTNRIGHFETTFDLDDEQCAQLCATSDSFNRSISYEASLDDSCTTSVLGRVHIVEDEGVSVISDIDDTVKVSNVRDRRELLANTLLRTFRAVEGMPDLYRKWEAAGVAFHYVSSSPWQLSNCLRDFLNDSEIPLGSLHLKLFRLQDSTPLGRLTSRKRSKRRTIERILADFPKRRFLLVGDSGERDPELYAAIARSHTDNICGVAIRQLPDELKMLRRQNKRLQRLAAKLPAGCMKVFSEASEIHDMLFLSTAAR